MKAVRIHEDGGPEVLRYEDVADPAPGPGEVLVRLRAASLNHLDLWIRQGLPSVPKPRILGADGAGVVAALGEGADTFSEGDRVVLNPGLDDGARILGEHMDGTHAEFYRMLVTKARIEEGEWVLLWGIGSGVALAAFVIAKALGARTLVTSSSAEKLARAAELGADATVNHVEDDVAAAVKEATGGRGVDVVIEHVGEATWKTSLQSAAPNARVVVCGATSGPNPPAQLHRIWWKQLAVYGSTMGTREDFKGAYELVARGAAQPIVDRVFPLEQAPAAHEYLEEGRQFGKVVLEIPG